MDGETEKERPEPTTPNERKGFSLEDVKTMLGPGYSEEHYQREFRILNGQGTPEDSRESEHEWLERQGWTEPTAEGALAMILGASVTGRPRTEDAGLNPSDEQPNPQDVKDPLVHGPRQQRETKR